jgi:amidase
MQGGAKCIRSDFCGCLDSEARRAYAEGQFAALAAREQNVRAFVCCDAAAARASLARSDSGPLSAALIAVKDIIRTADFPTCYGAKEPNPRALRRDAWCVAEARRRGGIILGKTVCTQFAYPIPGPTTNPHDARRTPGGSSSGSAAAVAAGFASFALGTQTAASTIRPASYCGITGYKPSFGLLPTDGIQLISQTLDHVGIFARSPRDAWYFTTAMLQEKAEVIAPEAPRRLLILQLPDAVPQSDGYRVCLSELAALLQAHGIAVDTTPLPFPLDDFSGLQKELCYWEAARILRSADVVRLAPELESLLARYRTRDLDHYAAARRRQVSYIAEFDALLARYEAVLTPAATGAAPPVNDTGDAAMSRFWTALHVPAFAIPMWRETNGLPLGLQLLGRLGMDRGLAATAQWFFLRAQGIPHDEA